MDTSIPFAAAAKSDAKTPPKKGVRLGTKTRTLTKATWHSICAAYMKHKQNTIKPMNKATFLRSELSGEHVTGTRSQGITFSSMLKKYENNELRPTAQQRDRKSPFLDVERQLVVYVKAQDKHVLSHLMLQQKALEYASSHPDQQTYSTFAASPGFLSNVLKRAGLANIKLRSEQAFLQVEDHATACIDFCKVNNFNIAFNSFTQALREMRKAQTAKKRAQSSSL